MARLTKRPRRAMFKKGTKRWRMLGLREVINQGDEYRLRQVPDDDWAPCYTSVGKTVIEAFHHEFQVRRRIK